MKKDRLRASLTLLRIRVMQMARYFRLRCCRIGNRSFLSTVGYLVLLVFIFCLFSTQLSLGRPNNDVPNEKSPRIPYLNDNTFGGRNDGPLRGDQQEEAPVNEIQNRHGEANVRAENKQRHHSLQKASLNKPTDGSTYPQLAPNGKFVPSRRIVHLDLKGGAYKDFLKRMQFTGILIEWEEMFPYTGQLSKATNGYVYKMEDVRSILQAAKDRNLEVIPLVQTIGHLEWILKLGDFVHLRDDPSSPQVICIGLDSVFDLIKDMIDQVAQVHKEFGMTAFHMGADEVFQFGFCNQTVERIRTEGTRDRAFLWHLSRVAKHIKNTYSVPILAWHDMFAHIVEEELSSYQLTDLLQPVLWSYAEDLEMYLPVSTWYALKPFKNVWGASVYKGADGPLQYHSHPMHYIRNHESWIIQFNRVYKEFDRVEGLIYSGWSRYDHMAILCELMPIAIPQLAFSAETMLEARPLDSNYARSKYWLGCSPAIEKGSFSTGCTFPGSKLYELVNEFSNRKARAQTFLDTDYDINGWLSRESDDYHITSGTVIDKIIPNIDFHLSGMEYIVEEFRKEAAQIYYQETIDEYVFVHMSKIIETLREKRELGLKLKSKRTFPKRPYIVYPRNEL